MEEITKCQYCTGEKPILDDWFSTVEIGDDTIYVVGCNGYHTVRTSFNINYCPMCGRKLEK